jgi:hypothetical protein
VRPHPSLSWSQLFEEFHCRECASQQAYRSRPRNFFERHVLPFLLLQPVRCDRCYLRVYVLWTVPALERLQTERKPLQKEVNGGSKPNRNVA